MLESLEPPLPFAIVADLELEQTPAYDRTTTYLVDLEGSVREIFPALIHMRPDWSAVLHRVDEVLEEDGTTGSER